MLPAEEEKTAKDPFVFSPPAGIFQTKKAACHPCSAPVLPRLMACSGSLEAPLASPGIDPTIPQLALGAS